MSQQPEERAQEIMAQATKVLNEAQSRLDEADEFFRASGLDREKTSRFMASQMTPADKAKLDAMVQADLEAVEREVQEARTRESANRPAASGGPRRPRPMV